MIVYAILALRRFLILSNQHHFNERGDGTDKKTKSTLTVVGTGGIGLFSISKTPFENLAILSVLLLVVLVILVVALVILACSILFVIVSNKRTRNLKNLIVAPMMLLERVTTKNKALPKERKKHH